LRSKSHEDHYGMWHTALWSCTHIPNIIDLSGSSESTWKIETKRDMIWMFIEWFPTKTCVVVSKEGVSILYMDFNYVSPSNEGFYQICHKSGRIPSSEHFWQVWLKSVQQFQRRRVKCEKLTNRRTTDAYPWQKLTWPTGCVVIESSFDPGERLQAPGSFWFWSILKISPPLSGPLQGFI
jgi:hypothetical protein